MKTRYRVTTIDTLIQLQKVLLNKVQQFGLKYYDDILERIPREEIDNYNTIFKKHIPKSAKYEIVASYR
jgi:hypothetical protein